MKKTTLSIALISLGLISLNAATVVEDALVSHTHYSLAGTFGAHDFPDAKPAFDWAFTTAGGASYQLQGNPSSATDVFGWKPVDIPAPKPAWYMFSLGSDVDGDGSQKFDWVLLSTDLNNKSAYKLAGEKDGSFEYSGPLDIDYKIDGNIITTGAAGAFDAVTPPQDDCDNGCNSIHSNNLAGYTVFIEDTTGIGVDVQEYIYIFDKDNKVKIVLNRKDGDQVVYEGTYKVKTSIGFGEVVDILVVHDESSSSGYTILFDDNSKIKEDQLGYTVTKILPNDKNGVVIKETKPTNGALVVNTVDDVKGYTISTNVAKVGTSGSTMYLSIAFNCDGSFDYHMDIAFSGYHSVNDYHGDELYVDDHFDTNRIAWHYVNEDGERSSDNIDTNVNNEIVPGLCWSGAKSDGSCNNNLEIVSVTKSECN